jgi:lipoate-protein ligase A
LVRGLKLFGVEATLQRSQPDFRASYRQLSSIPCFSSAARYEIEWRGRKFVGSAQRRYGEGERDVVLQHGSILTGPAHRRLAEYLATEDRALLEKVRGDLERKTTDLSEILGAPVDLDRLASSIRSGFELEWGLTFVGEDHPPASVPSHQEAP